MPWVHLIERSHNCLLANTIPAPNFAYQSMNAACGSVYQCNEEGCNRQYILRDSQKDGLFWEALPTPAPI